MVFPSKPILGFKKHLDQLLYIDCLAFLTLASVPLSCTTCISNVSYAGARYN
jgi:hypothetical protein